MPAKKMLLIIWHSRTGASEQAAAAAATTAHEAAPGINVVLMPAREVTTHDMLGAHAYLFVCPENLAGMTGAMKEFFDQQYYPCLDQLNGRAYACLVTAGSDGQGAVRQLQRIATGWRLREVAPARILNTCAQSADAILAPKTLTPAQIELAGETGGALAAGLEMGLF